MTKEQVVYLRDTLVAKVVDNKMQSNGYRVHFEDQIMIDSRKGFLSWDDTNQLVHYLKINEDHYTQMESPFEYNSYAYDRIVTIEAFYSKRNINEMAALYVPNISEANKKRIAKFVESINNTNIAPVDVRPYFKDEPTIANQNFPPIVRTDIVETDSIYKQGGLDN